MKKHVFTLLAIFMTGAVFAQTEQGSWLVGGNLNLNTAKNNTSVGIVPNAGYFFANNFAAGAGFDFQYNDYSSGSTTGFGIGPFVRYYFGTSNTRPLVAAQWSYTSTKLKIDDPESSTTLNGSNFFIGGGLAGFINRNVALEALAGYDHTNYRHSENGGGGFLLKVGFQVYLSGSQMSKAAGQ